MLVELLALTAFFWILYKFYIEPYNHWAKKGIPFIKGSFPFGSKLNFIYPKNYPGYVVQEYYNALSPHPYGGFYAFRRPSLLLRDPEIIKNILVKDFSHFRSRFGNLSNKRDPLSQHLFNLEGDLWKSVRVKLTPTFTSGKLKLMYGMFEVCSNQLQIVLNEVKNTVDVDIKDIIARFTTDIIATCAFGLEIGSMNNPDNEFRRIGQEIFPPYVRIKTKIAIVLFSIFPSLLKVFRITQTPHKMEKFLLKVIGDTIEYRKNNHVQTNDFLNLLLEIKGKEDLKLKKENNFGQDNVFPIDMDLGMITAQCFVFFAAGFETSSSVQSYALHELAQNQTIQDMLRKEIDEVLEKHMGKITYQALQEMPYMEQVIFETMRKYPTLPLITRECTKNYKMPDTGVQIDEGTRVTIPIYALHHDPTYFPDPEKFDPNRFSEENKLSIPQYAYIPFGEGPRICIGMRFGLLQTKLGIATVISNYKVLPSSKTQHPLKFIQTLVVSTTDGPIYLKLQERQK